mgnify:CR=1 FL=1
MKKNAKFLVLIFVSTMLFASCGGKNPVAGKKMALEAGGMSVVYVFTDSQFWLEGMDGLKLNYRYDKENDRIVYTELDGEEKTLEMSKLKEVK